MTCAARTVSRVLSRQLARALRVLGLSVLAAAASAQAADIAIEVQTLSYGSDAAQIMDLHTPVDVPSELMPAVVLAHGGLWQTGGRSDLGTLCRNIVRESRGSVACASIGYRLSQKLGGVCTAPGVPAYREQVADMAWAFARLQRDAAAHGLDPARIYIGGHSAGGHLAHTLNLRWSEFQQSCANSSGCPPARGAIGIEGVYDIPAWERYDQLFWGGQFSCATRKAFGAPPGRPSPCIEGESELACWMAGSPRYLAEKSPQLGIAPAGSALIIHSPGDDWVDSAGATSFGAAMSAAFPGLSVRTSTDGSCATGQHNAPLTQVSLARCIVDFIGLSQGNEASP
jgi:acetyl esterase/lipase